MKSSAPSANVFRVVFYKTQSVPLNNDNFKSVVNVISANGTLNHVFLKSVQNVSFQFLHQEISNFRYLEKN